MFEKEQFVDNHIRYTEIAGHPTLEQWEREKQDRRGRDN